MLARWCLLDWVGTKAKVASRVETCAQCAGEEAGEAGGGGDWQVLQPFHFHPVFPPAPLLTLPPTPPCPCLPPFIYHPSPCSDAQLENAPAIRPATATCSCINEDSYRMITT